MMVMGSLKNKIFKTIKMRQNKTPLTAPITNFSLRNAIAVNNPDTKLPNAKLMSEKTLTSAGISTLETTIEASNKHKTVTMIPAGIQITNGNHC